MDINHSTATVMRPVSLLRIPRNNTTEYQVHVGVSLTSLHESLEVIYKSICDLREAQEERKRAQQHY
jgi:DNA-binding HxlR family transcriptional regulator